MAWSALVGIVLGAVACNKSTPSEPEPAQKDPTSTSKTAGSAGSLPTPATAPTTTGSPGKRGPDPHDGSFTLAEALKDLKGAGAIVAKIDTSKGSLQCRLFEDKAPISVANFIGLATGKRAFKDKSGLWVNRPAYDGGGFHRIIKGFMIQGGDPTGTGSGEPGYTIKDELWTGTKHDKAGLLCMANHGPNTNGMQFFITDGASPWLDEPDPETNVRTAYTIFGECAPVEIIHDIAGVPVSGSRPTTPVTIKTVTISRDEKKK
jgi:peptidyl-prolyl cis-trans isomerase A (cyclophilin A)